MNRAVRVIAPIAVRQLEAWQVYAESWPWPSDGKHTSCGACNARVITWVDRNGAAYQFSGEEQVALMVGHLRNRHRDREAEVYGNAGL
jgi:hypothetical protein